MKRPHIVFVSIARDLRVLGVHIWRGLFAHKRFLYCQIRTLLKGFFRLLKVKYYISFFFSISLGKNDGLSQNDRELTNTSKWKMGGGGRVPKRPFVRYDNTLLLLPEWLYLSERTSKVSKAQIEKEVCAISEKSENPKNPLSKNPQQISETQNIYVN